MLITFLIFFLVIIILVGILWAMSPGKSEPFLGENGKPLDGSISEKTYVDINGEKQGMFIKSKNLANPVLLFLHGGPGMPEYWLTRRYPTNLANYFTVVWWEQRGAGLSYHPGIPDETMTTAQFIADTLELTRYLRKRFCQEKIYLLGHSWGSYIGIQAAAQAPELYYAYIGMGQVSYQLQSEQLAYEYALAQSGIMNDLRMMGRLKAAPPGLTVPLPADYESLRDGYMHAIGIGTMHKMKSVFTGVFLPSWQFREYTLGEKISLWRGKVYSRSSHFGLWETMLTTDLTKQVMELAIPVYFFHGKYDYTCAYPLSMAFCDQLNTPLKGFYTFENSAHSPLFEEPEKALNILLQDVLNGKNTLSDKR